MDRACALGNDPLQKRSCPWESQKPHREDAWELVAYSVFFLPIACTFDSALYHYNSTGTCLEAYSPVSISDENALHMRRSFPLSLHLTYTYVLAKSGKTWTWAKESCKRQ